MLAHLYDYFIPGPGNESWVTYTFFFAVIALSILVGAYLAIWIFLVPGWIARIRRNTQRIADAMDRTANAAEWTAEDSQRTANAMERVITRASGGSAPAQQRRPSQSSAQPQPRKQAAPVAAAKAEPRSETRIPEYRTEPPPVVTTPPEVPAGETPAAELSPGSNDPDAALRALEQFR